MNWRMILVAGAAVVSTAQANAMELRSAEMAEGASLSIEQVYGKCGGKNVSPSLAWSGVPTGTQSFALTVFDPDADGAGWWHWVVFDIPATAVGLAKGAALPTGAVEGENDFGDNAYDGACPPAGSGLHHYQFTLWALGTPTIPFDATATGQKIGPWLESHAVAKAQLVPVLQR
ncbi:MAG: YbhB/YbcL family Raf kinase inhibitor-like protein [Rhizomicrobium sp.]